GEQQKSGDQQQSGERPKTKTTLTTDDFGSSSSKGESVSSSRSSRSDSAAPRSENDRAWQRRMNDVQMAIEDCKLKTALDESNSSARAEMREKEQQLATLKLEGRKSKFQARPSTDLEYREKYVKLRTQMIKEERLHPPKERRTGSVYVQSNRPGRSSQRRVTT